MLQVIHLLVLFDWESLVEADAPAREKVQESLLSEGDVLLQVTRFGLALECRKIGSRLDVGQRVCVHDRLPTTGSRCRCSVLDRLLVLFFLLVTRCAPSVSRIVFLNRLARGTLSRFDAF